MPKIEVIGLTELIKKAEQLGKKPTGYVKRSLYVGAGLVADAIKGAVGGLPVSGPGNIGHKQKGVTAVEKAGLMSGIGISHMKVGDDSVEVVIGFNHTNADGVKNTTTMRRVESGTSIRQKIPTVRPAVNRTKAAAFSAMQRQFEKDLKEQFE